MRTSLRQVLSRAPQLVLILFGLCGLASPTASSDEMSWWPGFYGPLDEGGVLCSTVYQEDLVVGGGFVNMGGYMIGNLACWDGSHWSGMGSAFNGPVYALYNDGDTLFAAGAFTQVGDESVNGVAAWTEGAWNGLGTGLNGAGFCICMHEDDLFVGGDFTAAGGVPVGYIAKWDGSEWSSVAGGLDDRVGAITSWNGKLYAGGDFNTMGSSNLSYLAVLQTEGWGPVGQGVNAPVYELSSYEEDLLVAGQFTAAGGIEAGRVARWDGISWSTFGSGIHGDPPGTWVVDCIEWNEDLVVVGHFDEAGGAEVSNIALWNGISWQSCEGGCSGDFRTATVWGADLAVGGNFYAINGAAAHGLVLWTGEEWKSFGQGLNGFVEEMAVYGDLLVALGGFSVGGLTESAHILGWDGEEWQRLGEPVYDYLNPDLRFQAHAVHDGELVIGGGFINGWDNPYSDLVAAWDGTAWHALEYGLLGTRVAALHVLEGQLYAGGLFHATLGGTSLRNVAVWDGASWQDVGGGVYGEVHTMASRNDALYVGGWITEAGGQEVGHVTRWIDGSWHTLEGGVDGPVTAMTLYQDKIIVAGEFTAAGGVPVNNIAQWDIVTRRWSELGDGLEVVAGTYLPVEELVVEGPYLVACGQITAAGGQPAENVAYWYNGAWYPVTPGPNGPVNGLAFYGEELYLGGDFTMVADQPSHYIARGTGFAAMTAPEAPGHPARELRLWPCRPNPLQGQTRIGFRLPAAREVSVGVYDVLGRRVRSLHTGPLSPGEHGLGWDGCGAAGEPVPAGVYYIRLETPGEADSRPVLVVR